MATTGTRATRSGGRHQLSRECPDLSVVTCEYDTLFVTNELATHTPCTHTTATVRSAGPGTTRTHSDHSTRAARTQRVSHRLTNEHSTRANTPAHTHTHTHTHTHIRKQAPMGHSNAAFTCPVVSALRRPSSPSASPAPREPSAHTTVFDSAPYTRSTHGGAASPRHAPQRSSS